MKVLISLNATPSEELIGEQFQTLLSESSSVSSELRDVIRTSLEAPLSSIDRKLQESMTLAANRMKAWALSKLKSATLQDDAHYKELLTKIVNNPQQVVRELTLNIMKAKINAAQGDKND